MAIDGLAELGARRVRLLSIVAAPEGLAHLEAAVPDVAVYTAAIDRELNARKFILPVSATSATGCSGPDRDGRSGG